MKLWLFPQIQTLGVLAGLALIFGSPALVHAEKAPQTATSSSQQGKSHSKGKRTAQAHKKDHKIKETPSKKASKKKPRGKTAQTHSQPTRRTQPDKKSEKPSKEEKADKDTCVRNPVGISRLNGEMMTFPLTRCKGQPAEKSIERLSVMMRPYSVAKPSSLPGLQPKTDTKGLRDGEIAPGIMAVDPGLLSRLQAISSEFPGRTITLVSGYRPGGNGAHHRHGKAMDLRVDGVSTEALATFCRSLADTGCGYYPNSDFIHLDVRPKGTGHTYWIDAAAPGEASQLVSSWPPRKEDRKAKPSEAAPQDDTLHGGLKKKAGHGVAKADRDDEED